MTAEKIILISGGVSSGKTTLCDSLKQRFKMHHLKTKDLIKERYPGTANERRNLQKLGERLDDTTEGAWVRDEIRRYLEDHGPLEFLLVDAVRIEKQVEAIRRAYGPRVYHIHLDAPPEVLASRYKHRHQPGFAELKSYSQVAQNKTERRITRLREIADAVIDTARCTGADVLVRAASTLGLYGREHERLVDVVVGGQFGSEGKGHICSYLAREYHVLMRVGGPNAGHKVFQDPQPYTHHQLPSGTLFSKARLVIAPGAVIRVESLMKEIADCKIDHRRLTIDPQAMIIETEDIRREAALVKAIGSTGQGVGAATARRILARSSKKLRLARDISNLRPYIRSAHDLLESALSAGQRIMVEGTQGTGLSLYHGEYPHVTSRDTTVSGCMAEAGLGPRRIRKVMMVCRSYPIRVQSPANSTSGNLSREISWREVASRAGLDPDEVERREKTSTTNKDRRVGEFDWALLRKSASLNSPTDIALTFADYISERNTQARRFEQLTDETIRFTEEIEKVADAAVSLVSTRFHWRSIIDRRTW
jgi:adenylosuccinate synthase